MHMCDGIMQSEGEREREGREEGREGGREGGEREGKEEREGEMTSLTTSPSQENHHILGHLANSGRRAWGKKERERRKQTTHGLC